MAVIHKTTLTPSKLELLTAWLPTQPWYAGTGLRPKLAKAGGFRLDDPAGEVGIEFMVVTDESGDRPRSYHVPLTYRGAPLDGAGHALVGIADHGVLGARWIYDGAHDPVLVAQLFALLLGRVQPQAQNVSDTPDHSVVSHYEGAAESAFTSSSVVDTPDGTDLTVDTAGPGGTAGQVMVRVVRLLTPGSAATTGSLGQVSAGWRLPDGSEVHATFAVVPAQSR